MRQRASSPDPNKPRRRLCNLGFDSECLLNATNRWRHPRLPFHVPRMDALGGFACHQCPDGRRCRNCNQAKGACASQCNWNGSQPRLNRVVCRPKRGILCKAAKVVTDIAPVVDKLFSLQDVYFALAED